MSEHNEEYREHFQKEFCYLIELFRGHGCGEKNISDCIQSVVAMSYELGKLSVHNENGWEYEMEYPEWLM